MLACIVCTESVGLITLAILYYGFFALALRRWFNGKKTLR